MTTLVTILTAGYADWECALAMAVGRTFYGLTILTASPDGKSIASAGGLTVVPDMSLADIDVTQTDVLLVNGGGTWEGPNPPDISALLESARDQGVVIGAICAAVRTLAGAGLLDAIAHTGNNPEELAAVPGYDGSRNYRDVACAVSDGNIVTAAGTAPVSFMREVFAAIGKGGPELDFYLGLLAAEHKAA